VRKAGSGSISAVALHLFSAVERDGRLPEEMPYGGTSRVAVRIEQPFSGRVGIEDPPLVVHQHKTVGQLLKCSADPAFEQVRTTRQFRSDHRADQRKMPAM
jgi:hypothetical protein